MSTPLTAEKLEAIRARHSAASRGPWYWSGYTRGQQLGLHGPRMSSVMEFWRWGTQSAQPVFCVDGILRDVSELASPDTNPQRGRITAINHPDARFIASSWEDVRDLLAHVAALESAATPPSALMEAVGDFLATLYATPLNPYPTEEAPRAAGWADALRAAREGANAMAGAFNAARAIAARTAPLPTDAEPTCVDCGHAIDVTEDGVWGHLPPHEETSNHWARRPSETRARIAPTPVPTVPALVERPGKDGAR